jgi:hypothetical protein
MYVIGHNDSDVELILGSMIEAAARECDIASPLRQRPSTLGHKGEEMWFEISLQVGQISPIKLHARFLHLRTPTRTANNEEFNQIPRLGIAVSGA